MTKAFLPQMKVKNHGHIVTVASTLGLFSTACVEDYCASKFGAVGFHESLTHSLLTEEGVDGVKTTLICPYIVNTGMKLVKGIDQPEIQILSSIIHPHIVPNWLLPWEANVATYRFIKTKQQVVNGHVKSSYAKPGLSNY
uniref:Uncharacterized protein n=1 Tax=Sinocyclocheilus anshuiensis TaxID=1608454 RepID=A0A671NZH1_9TELE